MRSYLVVEGRTDAMLMRPLIETAGILNTEIIDAGGKSSAMSLGNSIALSRASPVAVLVDADTTDKRSINEQQTVFADLQGYSPPGVGCHLFLAIPTLEEELFPAPENFIGIYKLSLTPPQQARFAEDRMSVIKEFYSVQKAHAPATIRHGQMDWKAAQEAWGNNLLTNLFEFLRSGKLSTKSRSKRFA